MISAIRFLRPNIYGRPVGFIDTQMNYGVHELLVMRGIAEFVNNGSASPSDAGQVPQVEPDFQETERRNRRGKQKETVQ